MKLYGLVALGGGLGAVARYVVMLVIAAPLFPINIFAINLVGSYLIGVVMALTLEFELLSPELRLFGAVGFLGGFTTFSTYVNGVAQILTGHVWGVAAAYAIGSIVGGLLVAWLGLMTVREAVPWIRRDAGEDEVQSQEG